MKAFEIKINGMMSRELVNDVWVRTKEDNIKEMVVRYIKFGNSQRETRNDG